MRTRRTLPVDAVPCPPIRHSFIIASLAIPGGLTWPPSYSPDSNAHLSAHVHHRPSSPHPPCHSTPAGGVSRGHVCDVQHDPCAEHPGTMSPTEIRRHKSDFGKHGGFGLKRITFWGTFCLNLNNCMGPAMVLLPLLNQQAGWLTCTLAMLVAWFLSSIAATMLCESMQRVRRCIHHRSLSLPHPESCSIITHNFPHGFFDAMAELVNNATHTHTHTHTHTYTHTVRTERRTPCP